MSLRSVSSTLRYTGMGVGAGLVRLRLSEHWLDAGGDHVLSPEDLGHERLRLNETSHRGALGFQSRLERWMSREPVSPEGRMNFSARSASALANGGNNDLYIDRLSTSGQGWTDATWTVNPSGAHCDSNPAYCDPLAPSGCNWCGFTNLIYCIDFNMQSGSFNCGGIEN